LNDTHRLLCADQFRLLIQTSSLRQDFATADETGNRIATDGASLPAWTTVGWTD
jgi:hypothetical protein